MTPASADPKPMAPDKGVKYWQPRSEDRGL